ncbi:hypothetical protein Leryth_012449 [Lithospermum erythrorhizon]|nr:hypothetical protein Leryth_012449 [Lithospermum erythrorhizon]
MKRNCNLEVRLLPPSDCFNPSSSATSDDTQYHHSKMEIFNGKSSSTEQQKQMTIFFKGQMAVSHVTELQVYYIVL